MNRAMRRAGQAFRISMLGGEYATPMTCQEANCEAHRDGWFMALDVEGNDAHAEFATWVKEKSGRRFWEWRAPHALEEALTRQASGDLKVTPQLRAMLEGLAPGMLVFCFPPGQQCFKRHEDREVVFAHRQGIFVDQGRPASKFIPTGERIHTNPRDFNEHHNEEAEKVNEAFQKG